MQFGSTVTAAKQIIKENKGDEAAPVIDILHDKDFMDVGDDDSEMTERFSTVRNPRNSGFNVRSPAIKDLAEIEAEEQQQKEMEAREAEANKKTIKPEFK